MIVAGALGLFCGILLGRHFKVLVMVPAEIVAILVAALGVVAAGVSLRDAAAALLAWSVAAQLGYLGAGLMAAPRPIALGRPRRA